MSGVQIGFGAPYDDGLLGAKEDEITRFRDIWENRREIHCFRR
jgi:hypothetical protein